MGLNVALWNSWETLGGGTGRSVLESWTEVSYKVVVTWSFARYSHTWSSDQGHRFCWL